MARKRHRAEEIVAKLRQVELLVSQGKSAADAVRVIGVTEATYYRWRQEYGGLKGDQVRRLKELETEDVRLRRAVSGHVRQRGGNSGVAEVATDHAAMVAIWVGTASISGGVSSAIASVCM